MKRRSAVRPRPPLTCVYAGFQAREGVSRYVVFMGISARLGGLENRYGGNVIVGSNPTPSARREAAPEVRPPPWRRVPGAGRLAPGTVRRGGASSTPAATR